MNMIEELLSRTEAEPLLAPHVEALAACLIGAWADWQEAIVLNPKMATVRNSTRADFVYDRMVERAETYFDSVGIFTSKKRQFLTVSLDDGKVVLRFKKFRNRSLRTSGIPTSQRLEIEAQQVVFEGMAVTHLTVGYLPDELGINLDITAIVCSYNGRPRWSIDLDQASGGLVVPLESTKPVGPTVRSTRPAAREDKSEGQ